tara:strand:- start:1863 stop:2045 length:183 start_codon:yes stop_codon:yes gene_type:complete
MKNTMLNKVVVNQLNDVVRVITSKTYNGENIPLKMTKKVGLALSILTSDNGDLTSSDFVG